MGAWLLFLALVAGSTGPPPSTTSHTPPAVEPGPAPGPPAEPFRDFRTEPLVYPGPERDEPDPTDLAEVTLGWFGPDDPGHPFGGDPWVAATLAIERANAEGGYHGLPFRLIPGWSENPWGTGVAQVARMAWKDGVWALLGSIDGPATHLAEQIVAKARLTLVSPIATDPSVNLAGVSWMFSIAAGDHLWAPVLAASVAARCQAVASDRLVLLTATDHDSRIAAEEIRRALEQVHLSPVFRLDFHPGTLDFSAQLDVLEGSDPAAIVIVADAAASARAVVALRQRRTCATLFATPQAGRHRFRDLAGEAAEGVRLPLPEPMPAGDPVAVEFISRFQDAVGHPPDWAAVNTWDAIRLVVSAIRTAGLNRARIRDAIAGIGPWAGLSGQIDWDPVGQNRRAVEMAVIRDGRITGAEPPVQVVRERR